MTDISKSTLLVHCEQGFGDTFLMWGYMPRIKKFAQKDAKILKFLLLDKTGKTWYNNKAVGRENITKDSPQKPIESFLKKV